MIARYQIKPLLVLALILMPLAGYSNTEQGFRFVETTGRAVIMDEESINDARRNALEDAIFLAAMHGGAKINGFSAIDTETTLSDHFTLRPAGEIIDFNIVSESIEGEHYQMVIKAAVGQLNDISCSSRKTAIVKKFAPQFSFSAAVPEWLRITANQINSEISELISAYPNINMTEYSPIALKVHELKRTDDEFDYTALTRGRVRVANGEFAYVPQITMSVTKTKKNIENELFLQMEINSHLYEGTDYKQHDAIGYKMLLKLKSETPWRYFDILGKKTRDQIRMSLRSGLKQHADELVKKLKCVPLSANMKLKAGKLTVDLGRNHGITQNSLAVSEGENTPYSLLHVTEVFSDEAVLEPLNKSLETSMLIGKKINFMEAPQ
ncbi:MAG: flagellar assembly protein T N-terminal domain-containing protein [Pseudomonadota bacterium]|nr:flagellar assembly protein T N-terminal domain-containing protein [Pseudomonadota bacterium]